MLIRISVVTLEYVCVRCPVLKQPTFIGCVINLFTINVSIFFNYIFQLGIGLIDSLSWKKSISKEFIVSLNGNAIVISIKLKLMNKHYIHGHLFWCVKQGLGLTRQAVLQVVFGGQFNKKWINLRINFAPHPEQLTFNTATGREP